MTYLLQSEVKRQNQQDEIDSLKLMLEKLSKDFSTLQLSRNSYSQTAKHEVVLGKHVHNT